MFVSLERLGFNPTCLSQEVVTEGVYSDLTVCDNFDPFHHQVLGAHTR